MGSVAGSTGEQGSRGARGDDAGSAASDVEGLGSGRAAEHRRAQRA